jgi:hypothetical protein
LGQDERTPVLWGVRLRVTSLPAVAVSQGEVMVREITGEMFRVRSEDWVSALTKALEERAIRDRTRKVPPPRRRVLVSFDDFDILGFLRLVMLLC